MLIAPGFNIKVVRSVDTTLKHGYQIIVLCHAPRCAAVVNIVREQIDAAGLAVDEIGHQADGYQRFARVVARVRCTNAERSTLVRLVTRLGLEPAVRSVRWENVPE
jgi:hypothetical protein